MLEHLGGALGYLDLRTALDIPVAVVNGDENIAVVLADQRYLYADEPLAGVCVCCLDYFLVCILVCHSRIFLSRFMSFVYYDCVTQPS